MSTRFKEVKLYTAPDVALLIWPLSCYEIIEVRPEVKRRDKTCTACSVVIPRMYRLRKPGACGLLERVTVAN